MLKIRRPLGRLIFNMGIAIPGKTVFLIETAPRISQLGSLPAKEIHKTQRLCRITLTGGSLFQYWNIFLRYIDPNQKDMAAERSSYLHNGNPYTGKIPDSKVHGANMGPIWGRQDPGGPHVGPMNFAIWDSIFQLKSLPRPIDKLSFDGIRRSLKL